MITHLSGFIVIHVGKPDTNASEDHKNHRIYEFDCPDWLTAKSTFPKFSNLGTVEDINYGGVTWRRVNDVRDEMKKIIAAKGAAGKKYRFDFESFRPRSGFVWLQRVGNKLELVRSDIGNPFLMPRGKHVMIPKDVADALLKTVDDYGVVSIIPDPDGKRIRPIWAWNYAGLKVSIAKDPLGWFTY